MFEYDARAEDFLAVVTRGSHKRNGGGNNARSLSLTDNKLMKGGFTNAAADMTLLHNGCHVATAANVVDVMRGTDMTAPSITAVDDGDDDNIHSNVAAVVDNMSVNAESLRCIAMECSLVLSDYPSGFLGSFLSKGLKTNQLVVNTDEKTLRPIARLKEPRDLFALPKDKDHDCSQQAPRWPIECQVIQERITHIPYVPVQPEPLNQPTGNELKPRPVGEENGIVVFNYNPISAVNYDGKSKQTQRKSKHDESSDSDDSSDSPVESTPPSGHTPKRGREQMKTTSVSKMLTTLNARSTSNSNEEDEDDDDDDDDFDNDDDDFDDEYGDGNENIVKEKTIIKEIINAAKKKHLFTETDDANNNSNNNKTNTDNNVTNVDDDIDDIWATRTPEYNTTSPNYILNQFGKNVSKALINKMIQRSGKPTTTMGATGQPSSKYVVTPVRIAKKNLTRLEVAFQADVHDAPAAAAAANALTATTTKTTKTTSTTKKRIDNTNHKNKNNKDDADADNNSDDISSDDDNNNKNSNSNGNSKNKKQKRLAGGGGMTEKQQQQQQKHDIKQQQTVNNIKPIIEELAMATATTTTTAATTASASAIATSAVKAAAAAAAKARQRPRHQYFGQTLTGNNNNSNSNHNNRNKVSCVNAKSSLTEETKTLTNDIFSTTTTATITSTTSHNSHSRSRSRSHSYFSVNNMNVNINDDDNENDNDNDSSTTNSHYNNDNDDTSSIQSQFSRSAVGGAKFITNCHPCNTDDYEGLEFESRFESGNLAKAVQITPTYYELYLRPDLYTSRSKQWFYFRVRRTRKNMMYRFSIVNLVKSDSLYNDGMRPVMYSTKNAKELQEGWRRCGDNICYYRNDDESNSTNEEEDDSSSYTLTFTIEFQHDDDAVYFAHSYPYTYSDLQDYLMEIQRNPVKSKFCKLRLLCRTLAGNNVYYLTVTAPSPNEEAMKRKKSIVVSARVHPSETPASWMMKGLMDFITGDTTVAKRLRHKFIFKLIPMLNPDGVIVGNTRNSLTGKDLNRQYRTVIRETYPSIWYTKAMIRRLIEECGVAMYCDMHAHSRKHNIFIYGCENKRNPEKKLTEQVFPLMLHKNVADRFSFESCKFKIQRSKEGTGRIVVWMLGITNSYTIEASFGGSSLGGRKGTHFNTQERLRSKIIERLLREGSSADEPLNIPLSDYSSDEGNCSSSSDNEGKHSITASDLEGPCCAPIRAPPCSPEAFYEIRRFRINRMRKVMRELDRIYFTPLFQRKLKTLTRLKRRRNKAAQKAKRLKGGQEEETCANVDMPIGDSEMPNRIKYINNNNNNNTNNNNNSDSTASAAATAAAALNQTTIDNRSAAIASAAAFPIQAVYSLISPSINIQLPTLQPSNKSSNTTVSSSSSDSTLADGSSSSNGPTPTASQNSNLTANKRDGGNGKRKPRLKANGSKTKKRKKGGQADKTATVNVQEVPQKMRISRNFRLWLANRKIIIYRRKKVQRRSRILRGKALRKTKDPAARTPLDLPTTDPGSDLHFSTDDEEHASSGHGYGTVPPLRHSLLQSDLQRRYIEEIGDTVIQKPKVMPMPPELIVTTPSKSGKKMETFKLTARTAPELPSKEATLARRTYSWHNLNQDITPNVYVNKNITAGKDAMTPNASSGNKINKTTRTLPRRVPNAFLAMAHNKQNHPATPDELQLRLSLKKKVWTGTHGSEGEVPRPLAWFKQNALGSTTANTNATLATQQRKQQQRQQLQQQYGNTQSRQGAGGGVTRKSNKKMGDSELLAACSHKLLLWQQEEHSRLTPAKSVAARLAKHNLTMQQMSVLPQNAEEQTNVRNYKDLPDVIAMAPRNKRSGTGGWAHKINKSSTDPSETSGKVKRKASNTMLKIAETTQVITRINRARSTAAAAAAASGASSSAATTQQQRQAKAVTGGAARLYSAGNIQGARPQGHHHQQQQQQQQQGQYVQQQHVYDMMVKQTGVPLKLPPTTKSSKFKTGGLVVTAVQTTAAMEKKSSNSNMKTKIKKRKSRGGGGGAGGGGGGSGGIQVNVTRKSN